MKYLLAIDSYKGCMTAEEACQAAAAGLRRADPDAACTLLPLADGGEGTAAAIMSAMGGEVRTCRVSGPFGGNCKGYYGVLPGKEKAPALIVIDTAAASGLMLAKAKGLNPLKATTYGTGRQIVQALDSGCTDVVVGLGGSGTNDGGIGALSALGAQFFDAEGQLLNARNGGSVLEKIHSIDLSGLHPALKTARLRLLYDVAIPLTGSDGCSLNYSAQKGAGKATMARLEKGMQNYAAAINRSLSLNPDDFPGAGAAGGLGCGLMLAGGELVEGAPTMLSITGFSEKAAPVDFVITGEGKTDAQTASGKLPVAVSAGAKALGKPVVCLCGCSAPTEDVYARGIDAVFSITDRPMKLEESLKHGRELMEKTAYNLGRLLTSALK